MAQEKRPRAKDSDLGTLQQDYVEYLKGVLAGTREDTMTTAAHNGIRNLLKDNQIVIDPDVDNLEEHEEHVEVAMGDSQILESDFRRTA